MIILLIIFYIFLNKNMKRKNVEGFEKSEEKQSDKKEEEVESVDKNRMGCFKRKTPVIYTKDKRFTTSSFS